MGKYIGHCLVARPELDNTFCTADTYDGAYTVKDIFSVLGNPIPVMMGMKIKQDRSPNWFSLKINLTTSLNEGVLSVNMVTARFISVHIH